MGSIADRVQDLKQAKEVIQLLENHNKDLLKVLEKLSAEKEAAGEKMQQEMAAVQEHANVLRKKVFGESSERRPREKCEETAVDAAPRPGHGPVAQPNLPVKEVEIALAEDAEQRKCSACDGVLAEMGDCTEDSDYITVRPQLIYVVKSRRKKYVCKCKAKVVTAPSPTSHLPGGRYSLAFAAQVAMHKYSDHLPLARQVKIFERDGLQVSSQTLWDQIDALATHLEPSYQALRQYVVGADIIGADETWWRLMKKGDTKRWWAWSLSTPDAVWHGLRPSRAARTAAEFLDGFEGTVVCDGYQAYDTLRKANPKMQLAHCWAHSRRKFVEAAESDARAEEAIRLIGELFTIDRNTDNPAIVSGEARVAALTARLTARREQAPAVLSELRDWAHQQRALPKSSLRKAIDYMFRYWDGLTRFVDNPDIPLDNNNAERLLRGIVLGRKNHYGSRSVRGTQVAAIYYSLLETAKLNGHNPSDYLETAARNAIERGLITLPIGTADYFAFAPKTGAGN